ncbi:MAG TPA: ParA family protein [Ornithinibacter sp.]|nr:ParA family protein [Ornithinibacter sp.]
MDSDAAFQIRTAGQVGPTGRPLPDYPQPQPLASHGPARIIAMCNQKGGVGKTTTTINLGAALAEVGRRVLLVDFDPQGALSVGLGVPVNELDVTVYNLLVERGHDVRQVIKHTRWEGLDVLPANIDLSAAEVQLVGEVAREQILARVLRPVVDDYDVVLIDCPPSLGILTINGLTAANEVLIPLQCETLSHRGVGQLLETIDDVRSFTNADRRIVGAVATLFDGRTRLAHAVLDDVPERYGIAVLDPPIPKSVKLAEAPGYGQSVLTHAPSSKPALAYRDLARHLLEDAR